MTTTPGEQTSEEFPIVPAQPGTAARNRHPNAGNPSNVPRPTETPREPHIGTRKGGHGHKTQEKDLQGGPGEADKLRNGKNYMTLQ